MLVPCTVCRRHARVGEEACPFCGGALEAPRPRRAPTRRSRVAILFGAAIASASVGCGGSSPEADEPLASEPVASDPVGDEPSEPVDDPVAGDPDDDYGSAVAEYGVPSPE